MFGTTLYYIKNLIFVSRHLSRIARLIMKNEYIHDANKELQSLNVLKQSL